MKILPGKQEEYKKRHDEIWPALVNELRTAGVRDYVIYLDSRTDTLYASQKLTDQNTAGELAATEIVRKWWSYMADLMVTNPDKSPMVWPLTEMFYLE